MVTSVALIFTAIFTPIEVGFIPTPENRWSDPLFLINRVVDAIFVVDVILQFFIMVPIIDHSTLEGVRFEKSPRIIAKAYLTSAWAPVDFISVSVSAFDIFAPADSEIAKFKGFRAIRVLRLVKLMRIIKSSKIFSRWEKRLSIHYGILAIIQILATLIFICHLFACVWGLQASFDPLNKWPGEKQFCVAHADSDGPCPDGMSCVDSVACMAPSKMYVYSLYWSIATVTSIGYGDVAATPFNYEEQIICLLIMVCGALLFAKLVGSFCGLAASMSPEKKEFQLDMSDLNLLMERENIPLSLRYRLREYMHHSKYLRAAHTRQGLLMKLSPGIAAELALQLGSKWLEVDDLWFNKPINEASTLEARAFMSDVALLMRANVFPPGEACPTGHVYIVTNGRALYGGHVKLVSNAFGTDEIFGAEGLRLRFPAISSGYLHTYSIEGTHLRASVAKFPKTSKAIRAFEIRWIFRRGLVRLAEEYLLGQGQKFHGRQHAVLARIALSGSAGEEESERNLMVKAASNIWTSTSFRTRIEEEREEANTTGYLSPQSVPEAKSKGQFLWVQSRNLSAERPAAGPTPTAGSSHQPKAGDQADGDGLMTILQDTQRKQANMEIEVRRLASKMDTLQSSVGEIIALLKPAKSALEV